MRSDAPLPLAPFAALVTGLSVPFYALGALRASDDVVALPPSALAVVAPLTAAALLTRADGGSVRSLLASVVTLPPRRPAGWVGIAVATMPAIVLATHALLVVPDDTSESIGPTAIGAFGALALLGAYCEETGWAAYASRRLLRRASVLSAGLQVGAIWGAWHVVPFVQTNRSWQWVMWQSVFTVAFRVLLTALIATSGSALTAVLAHASYNIAWALLPAVGYTYKPAPMAAVTAVAALIAATVVDRSPLRGWRRLPRSAA
jgi:membrane protease YdiL (CAAX protease family)